eukprot:1159649-Pelagomonas_calceolata.AAC.12
MRSLWAMGSNACRQVQYKTGCLQVQEFLAAKYSPVEPKEAASIQHGNPASRFTNSLLIYWVPPFPPAYLRLNSTELRLVVAIAR